MAFDLTVVGGSITNTSARLRAAWSGYTNYDDGNYNSAITYNGSTVASVYNSGLTAYEGTLSGLSPGTTYTCNSYLIRDGGSNNSNVTFTTTGSSAVYPGIPSINAVSISNGKDATIYYSNGSNTSYVIIELSTPSRSWVDSFPSYSSPNSGSFPSYSTTYNVRAYGVSSTGNISAWGSSYSVTTGPQFTRPANWSWAVSKIQGGSIPTTKINATLHYAYILSATDWNSFTAKINAFLAYKQLSAGSFNTVYGGTDFTGAILNQAINNINRMLSSDYVYFTEDITAYVFNHMRDRLNSIV